MDLREILLHGGASAWLYIPVAILLGALHGLEPGHSKTMMAAFIIAIRGTIAQAVLLGLSAALSHSLVIWALAALALRFGNQWNAETTEPIFQLISAAVILAMAAWMFRRIRLDAKAEHEHHHGHHDHHGHDHGHGDDHHHHDGESHEHPAEIGAGRHIHTGHGTIQVGIFEDGIPPVFRLRFSERGKTFMPEAKTVALRLTRPQGHIEDYGFTQRDGFLESTATIPEPHAFQVLLSVSHGDHSHSYKLPFSEEDHGHGHEHGHGHGHHHHDHDHGDEEFQDAHEAAHAADIERRFANRQVTTGQIVLFGLTGGLMPCPAALTVLVVCLQLKKYSLGFALVAAFSIGLALIMVTVGVIAALGVRHAEKKMKGFNKLMRRAPYASCVVLVLIAAYMAWHGWTGLAK
ncbi:nickel/cobalt efflux transporter [Haloferula sp. BvORR071]|uniref:nickel/cobalt efflux transporter n=1 Tax=Haloferula sp. BvORR071 TaxID=1396141 RepID=UPI0005570B9F|nr:nickel/cobalt efflux transporter [Haloferula sp. BvORR071]